MASPSQITISANASLPPAFRIILLYFEPLCAILGAVNAAFTPQSFLSTMTRGTGVFAPDTIFLYTSLAGGWLFLALTEAVIMRAFDDLRLWRFLCSSMLISDIFIAHSTAQAVGGWADWADWADVSKWIIEDWMVFLVTSVPVLVRLFIILGIGVKYSSPRQG